MITHYILMSSSYSMGKRIALDYLIDEQSNYIELKEILNLILNDCGKDVSISTHFVQTDSRSWKSVVEKDHFFKNVELIDSIGQFINLIQADRVLIGLDIAKYILCKVKCTNLKLEKLVYLCYAEYLCKYNKELYKDKIYAYKYGPVVKSVYERYKGYGYEVIERDDQDIDVTDIHEMPSRCRILFAEDGINKITSIDETLEKYGKLSARDLVELTHRPNTPWSISGKGQYINEIIENNIIKEYHHNETVVNGNH